jgi:hypothetical protein
MKHSIWFLLALLLLTSACSRRNSPGKLAPDAAPDAVPPLEGSYVVNGFDPLGTEYSGVLNIFPGQQPGEYTLQWIIVGSIQQGRGVLQGNVLHVDWENLPGYGEEIHGTSTYTVTENGELYGTRTLSGHDEVGTETAYPNQ